MHPVTGTPGGRVRHRREEPFFLVADEKEKIQGAQGLFPCGLAGTHTKVSRLPDQCF